MASLNKVLLIGNLTRDPEVRMMSNGRPVCNFGLALNRSYKDSDGNRKEETTFVDVECFGPRAEAVGRFFSKGRSIFIEGRLKLDQWESKEGEKEVHCEWFWIISNSSIRSKTVLEQQSELRKIRTRRKPKERLTNPKPLLNKRHKMIRTWTKASHFNLKHPEKCHRQKFC